jgi:hypothetical protein
MKKFKINIKKIQELEINLSTIDNSISIALIDKMLDNVINTSDYSNGDNIRLSKNTLLSLGILEEEEEKEEKEKVQQLNS